jgi:hypothetical protein
MITKSSLTLDLKSSLNRAITYTIFPAGKVIPFTILHHKKTAAIQFDINPKSPAIKNKEVNFSMHRNLENSDFCKLFFRMENLKNDSYDYQSKFAGVNRMYEKNIYSFMKEKLDLQSGNSGDKSTNYLLILGWKLIDLDDDLIFIFVQRRCYNTISRTNVLRTAGIQFATKRGMDAINNYNNDSENSIYKVKEIPNLFDDVDNNKTTKQIFI